MSSLSDEPFVLLSYRHESPAHAALVAELAQRLRQGGVRLAFDQDHALLGAPAEGWIQWMRLAVERAAAVVVVWSPGYREAMDAGNNMPLPFGSGVRWEARILTARLYGGEDHRRVLSVVPPGGDVALVPDMLRLNYPLHRWPSDAELLVKRALHWQGSPAAVGSGAPAPSAVPPPAPDLGALRDLERFLLSAFSPSELHRLLRYLPGGADLVAAIPSHRHSSPMTYTTQAVEALHQRALIDGSLRTALVHERPRRSSEVDRVFEVLTRAGLAHS